MASRGMIYIPSLMMIGSWIRVILRVLPHQFERVVCRYYWSKRFLMYAFGLALYGMIYVQSFMNIGLGVQEILRVFSEIWNAVMLVLLIREIYEVCRWRAFRWHDKLTKFRDDRFKHLSNITATISETWMLVLLIERSMKYAIEMASCDIMYILSFMKIGTDVQ
jgi:hypothetical protein